MFTKAVTAITLLLHALSASCLQTVNFYDVLKVPTIASMTEIDQAYRALARQYSSSADENSLKTFEDIKRAYEVLIDEERRHVYDYEGIEALEVFEEQSGGFFKNFSKLPKAEDAVLTLAVTLEELYKGNLRLVEIKRDVTCGHCEGTGTDRHGCEVCEEGASGVCPECEKHAKVCPVCHGNKIVPENKVFTVDIERGMADGDEIRLVGESERKPGFAPGDLVFKLKVEENEMFYRQENDLDVPLHITLRESLLGFKKNVTHIDGRQVEITGEGVTDPYAVKKVDGEGMPIKDQAGQFGDLYVEIIVDYPSTLSQEDQEVVDKLFKA